MDPMNKDGHFQINRKLYFVIIVPANESANGGQCCHGSDALSSYRKWLNHQSKSKIAFSSIMPSAMDSSNLFPGLSSLGPPVLPFTDPLLQWYHLHIQNHLQRLQTEQQSLQRLQTEQQSLELQTYLTQGKYYISVYLIHLW